MAELSTLIHRSTLGGGIGDIKVKQYFAPILKQEKGSGSASRPAPNHICRQSRQYKGIKAFRVKKIYGSIFAPWSQECGSNSLHSFILQGFCGSQHKRQGTRKELIIWRKKELQKKRRNLRCTFTNRLWILRDNGTSRMTV